jgi:hypothetical protein
MEIQILGYCLSIAPLISSIGLLFDMVGAVIIFRFGIPQRIDRSGHAFITDPEKNEEEKNKARLYDRISFCGISLLVIGFALQGVANWI